MIVRELLTLLGFEVDEAGAAKYEQRTDQSRRKTETATSGMARSWEKVGAAIDNGLRRAESGLTRAQGAVDGFSNGIGGLASLLGGGLAFAGFADITSRLTDIQSRLAGAVEGTGESADELRQKLLDAANAAFVPFEQAAEGFFAAKPALDELGIATSDQIDMTVALGDMLTVAAVKGEGAARAMMWFNRTLSVGKMTGEAFSNIMETDSDLLQGFREHLGLTVGAFNELGREGKFTTEQFVGYLRDAGPRLRQQSSNMAMTINDAFVIMRNNFEEFIYGAGQVGDASDKMARAILWFAERPAIAGSAALGVLGLGLVAIAAQAASAALSLGIAVVKMVQWLRTLRAAQILTAVTNPWVLLTAAIVAAGLAVQDFTTWLAGGESTLGSFIGRYEDLLKLGRDERSFGQNLFMDLAATINNTKEDVGNLSVAWQRFMASPAGTFGDQLANIGNLIKDAASALFSFDFENSPLMVGLRASGAWVSSIIASLRSEWSSAWESMASVVSDNLSSAWTDISNEFKRVFEELRGWFTGWVSGIGSNVRGVFSRLTGGLGAPPVPGESGGRDAAPVPGEGGTPLQVPGRRAGGPVNRGLYLVGEEGPEVVEMGGRGFVTPADKSRRYLESLGGGMEKAARFGMAASLAAAPALAAISPSPALAGLDRASPSGWASPARSGGVNLGGVTFAPNINVTASDTSGMGPEELASTIAEKTQQAARDFFDREVNIALRHFTDQEE